MVKSRQILCWLLLAMTAWLVAGCAGTAQKDPGAPARNWRSAGLQRGAAPAPEAVMNAKAQATAPMAPPSPPAQPAPIAQASPKSLQSGEEGAVDPGQSAGTAVAETASDATVAAPLLIYTANLVMGVFEAAEAIDQAEKLALDAGGYLVRRDDQSITVRVPAGKFQGTLEEVLKLGDVRHRDVKVQDVTEQFHDLQIRLRNAEAVLARLHALLDRAQSVKDALAVEAELARVAGQVEQLKGRLKLLRELIAFSTITVRFDAQPVEQLEPNLTLPFPWLDSLGLGNLLDF
jgi:hypothetical protein